MLKVLFAADFPIARSGIASTASAILAQGVMGSYALFSDQGLALNGKEARPISELSGAQVPLIFTHTEYSGLAELSAHHPTAVMHVGDWPLLHWASVRKVQPIKGLLATWRCQWRLRKVNRDIRFAFVTQNDRDAAAAYGFINATHLPIGVRPPETPIAPQVDTDTVCFSGNFRYAPNRDAAQRLLRLAASWLPEVKVVLVGFFADDFAELAGPKVELHADVPSIVDFLATRRPLYVSLIATGAGAKNKILEAMVAGCPIVCTPESLDASIRPTPSMALIDSDEAAVKALQRWRDPGQHTSLNHSSQSLANDTRENRSWRSVATKALGMLAPSAA